MATKKIWRLLATMIVMAAAITPSSRIAFAQIPEAPGTYIEPNGNAQQPVEIPPERPRKVWATATPDASVDSARDTINVMERARARASGTPVPEPSPGGSH